MRPRQSARSLGISPSEVPFLVSSLQFPAFQPRLKPRQPAQPVAEKILSCLRSSRLLHASPFFQLRPMARTDPSLCFCAFRTLTLNGCWTFRSDFRPPPGGSPAHRAADKRKRCKQLQRTMADNYKQLQISTKRYVKIWRLVPGKVRFSANSVEMPRSRT